MSPPLPEPSSDDSNTIMTLTQDDHQYSELYFSKKDVSELELNIDIMPTAELPIKWQLKMISPGNIIEELLLILVDQWK